MDKLKKIKSLLADIGTPPAQQSDLCALTILAMANLKEIGSFASATNNWIRIHDVIAFINVNYSAKYAEIQEKLSVNKPCTILGRRH